MFCEAVCFARLIKAEIVYPFYGFLINTDVGNPNRALYHAPSIEGESRTVTETALGILPLYNRTKARFFSSILHRIFSSLQVPTPRAQIRVLRTFNYVRLRSSGPVDALLCHGGGRAKAARGQVPVL